MTDNDHGGPRRGAGPSSAREFQAELGRMGVDGWSLPGGFVESEGLWVTEDPKQVSFPDSAIEILDSIDTRSFWFDHRNSAIRDLLDDEVPKGLPFVEVGSGTGVVCNYIRLKTDRPVLSIEPMPAGAIAVARKGVRLSICGDLQSLRLPDGSLPVIGAFDVVEHLDDPDAFLRECRRVLRSDGRLLLTVPAYQWLWSEFDVWNGHVQRFSTSSLSALLVSNGFQITRSTHLFAALVLPAFVMRVVVPTMKRGSPKRDPADGLDDALAPTSPFLDILLRGIHRIERRLLGQTRIPFGTSILVSSMPIPAPDTASF